MLPSGPAEENVSPALNESFEAGVLIVIVSIASTTVIEYVQDDSLRYETVTV